mmetsp:Transcript_20016/g.56735  ORF Transcript_20016/g.56735 Transcript_20016/m.56735 type:complete len:222 (-) Transcript_20016:130-795(-)
MAPCPITSIILIGSNPTDSDRARPSPKAATMVPMSELMTSFARVPYPTSSEKKWLALPMAFRPVSLTSSNKALSPAHRKMSVPVIAGTLDPDTGASRNRPPALTTASLIFFMSSSPSVAQSTMALPSDTPAKTPSSPSKTALLTSGVESMEYTMLQLSTSSLAVSMMMIWRLGYFALKASHLDCVRFHRMSGVASVPAIESSMRHLAMPSPMMPSPMKPTA